MQASYHSPLEGESQKLSRQAKADAVGGQSPTLQTKADAVGGAEPKDCGPRPRQVARGRDLSPTTGSLKMTKSQKSRDIG